jgi:outer membrane protein
MLKLKADRILAIALIASFSGQLASANESTIQDPALHLTIAQAVERALKSSPELQEARQTGASSESAARAASKGALPTLSLVSGISYFGDTPIEVGADLAPLQDKLSRSIALRLDEKLYSGGKTQSLAQRAQALEVAGKYSVQVAERTLEARVREQCYEVLRAQALLASSSQLLAVAKNHKSDVDARVSARFLPRVEGARAEIRVKQVELDQLEKAGRVRLALDSLSVAVGLPMSTPIQLDDSLPQVPDRPPGDLAHPASAPELILHHPEILTAREFAHADQSAVGAVSADYYPQLSAFGAYGYQRGSYLQQGTNWEIGLNLNWELFAWGKTRNEVDAARAIAQASESRVTARQDRLMIELNAAKLKTEKARQSMRLALAQVAVGEDDLRLSQTRFAQGVGTGSEVIDAQGRLSQAKTALIDVQADYAVGLNRIRYFDGEPSQPR